MIISITTHLTRSLSGKIIRSFNEGCSRLGVLSVNLVVHLDLLMMCLVQVGLDGIDQLWINDIFCLQIKKLRLSCIVDFLLFSLHS